MSAWYGLAIAAGAALLGKTLHGSPARPIPGAKKIKVKAKALPRATTDKEYSKDDPNTHFKEGKFDGLAYDPPWPEGWAVVRFPDPVAVPFGGNDTTRPGVADTDHALVHVPDGAVVGFGLKLEEAFGLLLLCEQVIPGLGKRKIENADLGKLMKEVMEPVTNEQLVIVYQEFLLVPWAWQPIDFAKRQHLKALLVQDNPKRASLVRAFQLPGSPYTGPLARTKNGFLWAGTVGNPLPDKESMLNVTVGRQADETWVTFVDGVFLRPRDGTEEGPAARQLYKVEKDVLVAMGSDPSEVGVLGWVFGLLIGDRLLIEPEAADAAREILDSLSVDERSALYRAFFDVGGLPRWVLNPNRTSEQDAPNTLPAEALLKLGRLQARLRAKVSGGKRTLRQEYQATTQEFEQQRSQRQKRTQTASSTSATQSKPQKREADRRKTVSPSRKRMFRLSLGSAYVEQIDDGSWVYVSEDGGRRVLVTTGEIPTERDIMRALSR